MTTRTDGESGEGGGPPGGEGGRRQRGRRQGGGEEGRGDGGSGDGGGVGGAASGVCTVVWHMQCVRNRRGFGSLIYDPRSLNFIRGYT